MNHFALEEDFLPEIKTRQTIIGAILILALIVFVRTAWIGDDAAITIRTVLNFIYGYGPTFNIDERVQAYTHPLWFLLISAFSSIFGNPFYVTFILSIVASMLAFWLLLSQATNFYAGLLAVMILLLSKAYVDFSASGLENPLSHFLIISCVLLGYKALQKQQDHSQLICIFLCSILYLSRPDLLILIGPFTVIIFLMTCQSPKCRIQAIVVFLFPILLWTAFSLIYYGFPFPNTAYAKLGTGISLKESAEQGLIYLIDSVARDPITLPMIVFGIIVGMGSSSIEISLAVGCLLYLTYIIRIGGDFMSGRFLTSPLLVSSILLSRSKFSIQQIKIVAIAAGILGLANINANFLSGRIYPGEPPNIPLNGIADERGFYFQSRGLLLSARDSFDHPKWEANGIRNINVACGGLGYASIMNGPATHYIDNCALADPLLARLPAQPNPKWRIGHFMRQIPANYVDSVRSGTNLLLDPVTKNYYDSIRIVTRGPLLSYERLREILRLNLGLIKKPGSIP